MWIFAYAYLVVWHNNGHPGTNVIMSVLSPHATLKLISIHPEKNLTIYDYRLIISKFTISWFNIHTCIVSVKVVLVALFGYISFYVWYLYTIVHYLGTILNNYCCSNQGSIAPVVNNNNGKDDMVIYIGIAFYRWSGYFTLDNKWWFSSWHKRTLLKSWA